MSKDSSLRIARPPGEPPAAEPGGTFTVEEKKRIFKTMVVAALDAGFLRYSRRQELLAEAARLGIGEFEACLLIAEAQFHSAEIDPADSGELTSYDSAEVARGLSISTQLTLALIAAVLIDLVVLAWLL